MSETTLADLAEIILGCIHREYPNQVSLGLRSADDLALPHQLYPAFYGSFDWHSAVHGHWSLARVARCAAEDSTVGEGVRTRAIAALRTSLTADKLAVEEANLARRTSFECPYGLAWLLLLEVELTALGDELADEAAALAPVAARARENFTAYLGRLTHPVRSGQHDQSAFGIGLALDAARLGGHSDFATALEETARRLHAHDHDAPLHFEPSNHDFLSPAFAAADLMRRVLPGAELSAWLGRTLPQIPTTADEGWFLPIDCPDPSDGRLAHRIGLNLSRAWMLEAVAEALPAGDPRQQPLTTAAAMHRAAGVAAIDPQHYSGAHWLGTFAIHLLTGRSEGPPRR